MFRFAHSTIFCPVVFKSYLVFRQEVKPLFQRFRMYLHVSACKKRLTWAVILVQDIIAPLGFQKQLESYCVNIHKHTLFDKNKQTS